MPDEYKRLTPRHKLEIVYEARTQCEDKFLLYALRLKELEDKIERGILVEKNERYGAGR